MRMAVARSETSKSPPDKHHAILNAALEVFAERGVNGVAVPEIAANAGVGTGTIYRYFTSKEALVNGLFRRETEALGRRLHDDFPRDLDPKAAFGEFWKRATAFAREAPQAYRFLELQDHRSYLDRASRRLERRLLSPMQKNVRVWQEKKVFRRDLKEDVVMAMIWGAIVNLFKAERDGYLKLTTKDLNAARDACFRMFLP